MKAVAVLGVICLHAIQPKESLAWQVVVEICRFAVPCFFLATGFFFMDAWRRDPDQPALIWRYANRLLKPFLFWGIFYAVIPPFVGGAPAGIKAAVLEHLLNIVKYPHSFLLTWGNVYHLWFLSSLLQAAAIVWICLRLWNLRAALLIGALFYGLALMGGPYSEVFFGFHLNANKGPLVSTLFFAIGAWLADRRPTFPPFLAGVLLGSGLWLHLAEASFLHGAYGRPLTSNAYLLGTIPYAVGVMLLALSFPRLGLGVARLGTYSLGIYAFHVYIIEILLGLPIGRTLANSPLLFCCVVFGITLGVVVPLSKIAWARPFIL